MDRIGRTRCRLSASFEEALRCRLEVVLAPYTFDLSPDDIALIIDDTIDAFTQELERAVT
jgi:hypothetical protein